MGLQMADGLDTLLDLRRRLYRMLDLRLAPEVPVPETFAPRLDIVQGPQGLSISVELPGMTREEISVEMQGNLLIVTGERRTEPAEGMAVWRRERPRGPFRRSLALPTTNHNELSAVLKDGVLTVTVKAAGQAPGEGS
jgi:HSP20 family protein